MDHWHIVADFGRARFFEQKSVREEPREVFGFDNKPSRQRTQDLVTDRPGAKSRGNSRTDVEPHTDPREVVGERFARELATFLEESHQAGRFLTLSLVVAPGLLGKLRPLLSDQVTGTVEDTHALDLINMTGPELGARLKALRQSG